MDTSGRQIPDKQKVKQQYRDRIPLYEEALDKFHHLLKRELAGRELRATVKTRVKSFDSYYRKLLMRLNTPTNGGPAIGPFAGGTPVAIHGGEDSSTSITDVLGVRIVCPFLEQVEVACDLIRSLFEVVHFEEKGADHSFREFGYQSTHFLVRIPAALSPSGLPEGSICEIQVCTLLQDAWAEVEHELIYKAEFTPLDEPLRRKLAALNANLTLSDIIFQEIRDYQRQLHSELLKRRRDFLDRVKRGTPAAGEGEPDSSAEPEHNGVSGTSSLDDLLLQALYAHNERKYNLAIKYYTKILSSDPSTRLEAIVLVHRGMAYFAKQDFIQALKDFKKAIKVDPKNGKAFYYRGIVYRTNRDYRKALRDFDRSLELSPYEFDALLSRSRVHLELGDFRKALDDCDNALRIEPDDQEALLLRSRLLSCTGEKGLSSR